MSEDSSEPVYFYSKTTAYYELSNFSPHGFQLDGVYWPTVEHYFQAQKFPSDPAYQEKIRQARTPKEAKSLGRSRKVPLRPDWEQVKEEVMRKGLRAKFTVHPELAALLLGTGTRQLIENAPSDNYWGCGHSGSGKNRLGALLMELRTALKRRANDPVPMTGRRMETGTVKIPRENNADSSVHQYFLQTLCLFLHRF